MVIALSDPACRLMLLGHERAFVKSSLLDCSWRDVYRMQQQSSKLDSTGASPWQKARVGD
ncbi:hypothetical protein C1930_13550 [Stenotrophomonas sp. SAU14A_NAIMI4_8]|nr:hypothetical protein C1931_13805 [Stenotrophomonas sp. YAU14A_MKIMI4_1]AWH33809.1 hypothetical protein C1930_13545 [Stenotrophomonas sp. SAU14A_NAIMI4_8]AWH33810.1 hypothetical protein C1930_13550 [Stenotrophomonas sp. SAU14A_NAIMI4_8]